MVRISSLVQRVIAIVLFCSWCVSLSSFAQSPPKPLSKDDVVQLLKGSVSSRRVAELARQRGIDFPLTEETERELREATATDSLIFTLRELAPNQATQPTEKSLQQAQPRFPTLSSAGISVTGDTNIGVIDIQRAIVSTSEGSRDFSALQKKFEPKRNELVVLNTEVENLKKQLNTQGDTMNQSVRSELVKTIEAKQKSLQRSAEDAQKEFQQQQNEIAQRILQKMAPVIDKHAKENGYTLLIDSSNPWPQGPLLWAAASVDLTKVVVQAYDAASGSAAHTASTAVAASSRTRLKVGIINIQQAIVGTDEGAQDLAILQKKFEPKRNELAVLNTEIENLKKQLNTQGGEARATLVKSIETKAKSLQRLSEDSQKDFQQQQNEIAQRILQKLAPVIDKYAKANSYGLLFDSSNPWPQGPLFWATAGVDLTKRILEAYEAQPR